MTPKEKAEELVEKMAIHHWTDVCDYESAKQCALIAVDEILLIIVSEFENKWWINYLQEVKQEIEKL